MIYVALALFCYILGVATHADNPELFDRMAAEIKLGILRKIESILTLLENKLKEEQ